MCSGDAMVVSTFGVSRPLEGFCRSGRRRPVERFSVLVCGLISVVLLPALRSGLEAAFLCTAPDNIQGHPLTKNVSPRVLASGHVALEVGQRSGIRSSRIGRSASEQDTGPSRAAKIVDLLPSLPEESKQALQGRDIVYPSPIQALGFLHITRGESVILHSETGSGKTLAFLLPALHQARNASQEATVLVIAPTRELAVQTVSEAEPHCHGEIALVTLSAQAAWNTILGATLIVATPSDFLEALDRQDAVEVHNLFSRVRVLVMDEFDELLPKGRYEGQQRFRYQDAGMSWMEAIIKRLVRNNEDPSLQILAASATAYKASRVKLTKILRKDQQNRFRRRLKVLQPLLQLVGAGPDASIITVRSNNQLAWGRTGMPIAPSSATEMYSTQGFPSESGHEDDQQVDEEDDDYDAESNDAASPAPRGKSAKSRYPALPPGIEHFTWRVSVGGSHLQALAHTLEVLRPESAIVFLCPNAGETVKGVVDDLQAAGWGGVQSLSKELFPDSRHSTSRSQRVKKRSAEAKAWRSANRLQDLRETTKLGWSSVASSFLDAPILITSEESVRGLHLDAVEAVFIVGLPRDATSYLHMAGRTGRLPHPFGRAVLVAQGREIAKVTRGFEGQTQIRQWTELNPRDGRTPRLPRPQGSTPWVEDFQSGGVQQKKRSAAAERLDAALGPSLLR